MTNTTETHAHARMGLIADLGYSIISQSAADGLVALASKHAPAWSVSDFETWRSDTDSIMIWLDENLGSTHASNLEQGSIAQKCAALGNATVISDLYDGARLGLILSHSKDILDEDEIKEARAAAITLQIHHRSEPGFAITAKELIYLEQVSAGATDDEVAEELQLSLRAVKERKRKAIDDLNAKNIGHAIGIAKRTKLI